MAMTETPPTQPPIQPWRNYGQARLKAFSDGVFAIVITLLVLELKVPRLADSDRNSAPALLWALASILPKLMSYATSFIIVGIYWVAQVNMFRYVKRVDRTFMWINILYLMAVSLIAFTAALIGSYPDNRAADVIYGLNLMAVGLVLSLMWHYAQREGLTDDEHHPSLVKAIRWIGFIPVIIYAGAVGLAILSSKAALLIYAVVPAIYIYPGFMEGVLEKVAAKSEAQRVAE